MTSKPTSVLGSDREARLIRAIAAHRKVNPAAYRGVGLTKAEDAAMAAALYELEEQLEAAEAAKRPVPTSEGGPGHEEQYWLKAKLNACIRHLRDIEDFYRLRGGLPEGFNMIRADRARSLYEQISEDFLNGKTTVPTMREAAARAVFLAEHLFQMIPDQTWRDSGGDDGQGHYEGEYRAASLRDELAALSYRVSNPASRQDEALTERDSPKGYDRGLSGCPDSGSPAP